MAGQRLLQRLDAEGSFHRDRQGHDGTRRQNQSSARHWNEPDNP
jgi:hypothetical protein